MCPSQMWSLGLWFGNKQTLLHIAAMVRASVFLNTSLSHHGRIELIVFFFVQVRYSAEYFVVSQLTSKVQLQCLLSALVF